MHFRSLLSALAFLALTAACTPVRDNPYDPSNAPKVELRILDLTGVNGHCMDIAESGTVVQTASRVRCLAVEAFGVDPQGSLLVEYEFSRQLLGTSSQAAALEEFASGPSPVALVGTAYLRSWAPGVPIAIEARVTDSTGDIGVRQITLTLSNTPPVAIAPPSRTFPFGGFPWAPGVPMDVYWDPSASFDPDDPDGELELTYCFDFPETADDPAENDVCGPKDSPLFARRLAPDVFGRAMAYLTVLDPYGGSSARVPAPMYVGVPNLWAAPIAGAGTIHRIDTARASVLGGNGPNDLAVSGSHVAVSYAISAGPPIMVSYASWPDLVATGTPFTIAPGAGGIGLGIDADAELLWGVGPVTGSGPLEVKTWTLSGGTLGNETSRGTFVDPAMAIDLGIEIASDGSAWIAREGGAALVVRVPPVTGALVESSLPAGRIATGIASRPETDEVWVLESRDFIGGTGLGPVHLFRYTGSGALIADAAVDADLATGLRWADAESFWTFVPGEGLLLLDADEFFAGTSLPLSTRTAFPEVLSVEKMVVDAMTGDCWVSAAGDASYRATPSGELLLMEALQPIQPAGVDGSGGVFYTQGVFHSQPTRGHSMDSGATAVSLALNSLGRGGVDRTNGWLWVPTLLPATLVQIGEQGQAVRTVDRFVVDGVDVPVPSLFPFRLSADGQTAWGMERAGQSASAAVLGMWHIDLAGTTGRSVVARKIAGVEAADWLLTGLPQVQGIMEPSPPGVSPAYLWVYNRTTGSVHQLSEDGPLSASMFDVPSAERPLNLLNRPLASVSLSTGKLCLVTQDEVGNDQIHVRRIAPAGGAPEVFPLIVPSNVGQFVASTASAGDACFLLYSAGGISPIANVASFTTGGVAHHPTFTTGSLMDGLVALSPDEIWLFGGERLRAKWTGAGWAYASYNTDYSQAPLGAEAITK